MSSHSIQGKTEADSIHALEREKHALVLARDFAAAAQKSSQIAALKYAYSQNNRLSATTTETKPSPTQSTHANTATDSTVSITPLAGRRNSSADSAGGHGENVAGKSFVRAPQHQNMRPAAKIPAASSTPMRLSLQQQQPFPRRSSLSGPGPEEVHHKAMMESCLTSPCERARSLLAAAFVSSSQRSSVDKAAEGSTRTTSQEFGISNDGPRDGRIETIPKALARLALQIFTSRTFADVDVQSFLCGYRFLCTSDSLCELILLKMSSVVGRLHDRTANCSSDERNTKLAELQMLLQRTSRWVELFPCDFSRESAQRFLVESRCAEVQSEWEELQDMIAKGFPELGDDDGLEDHDVSPSAKKDALSSCRFVLALRAIPAETIMMADGTPRPLMTLSKSEVIEVIRRPRDQVWKGAVMKTGSLGWFRTSDVAPYTSSDFDVAHHVLEVKPWQEPVEIQQHATAGRLLCSLPLYDLVGILIRREWGIFSYLTLEDLLRYAINEEDECAQNAQILEKQQSELTRFTQVCILRGDDESHRITVIKRLLALASACARSRVFSAAQGILEGLQSPSVARLRTVQKIVDSAPLELFSALRLSRQVESPTPAPAPSIRAMKTVKRDILVVATRIAVADEVDISLELFAPLFAQLRTWKEEQQHVPCPVDLPDEHFEGKKRSKKVASVYQSVTHSTPMARKRRDSMGSKPLRDALSSSPSIDSPKMPGSSPLDDSKSAKRPSGVRCRLPSHWAERQFASPLPVHELFDDRACLARSFQIEPRRNSESSDHMLEAHETAALSATASLFNERPENGIKLAERLGLISKEDAAETANFLRACPGLSLKQIGEFIGKAKNAKVLKQFIATFDFRQFDLCSALRHFFAEFRLPGEAQIVDRIVEAFAERYFECCKQCSFKSKDTVYVLSFSIVMLNTDRHNPAIKDEKKMSFDEFVRNNRGIDGGNDVPHTILKEIFDDICEQQMRLEQDAVSFGDQNRFSF